MAPTYNSVCELVFHRLQVLRCLVRGRGHSFLLSLNSILAFCRYGRYDRRDFVKLLA